MEGLDNTNPDAWFFRPKELSTALAIRACYKSGIVPVAGATWVARSINAGEFGQSRLLDLTGVRGFSGITPKRDCYEIAAGTSFRALEDKVFLTALAEAAKGVGGPAIRNRATLGGNLASARRDGDGSVATLAFPSEVELRSETGMRRIEIDNFFGTKEGETAIRADELITKIIIPKGWIGAWYEVGVRVGASHSIVCCAAALSRQGLVRIAFGGAAETVCRARLAEAVILKEGLTERSIQQAAEVAREEVRPPDDWRASSDYRRNMCAVMVKRVLDVLKRSRGKVSSRKQYGN